MHIQSKPPLVFALLFLGLFLVGCGGADYPDRGVVTGKVTMNGEPVPNISIMAAPMKGRTSYGRTEADGSYELMYTIDVSGTELGPNKITMIWPTGVSGPGIPKEYLDMTLDVKNGSNVYDIEMKSTDPAWKNYTSGGGGDAEAADNSAPAKGKKKRPTTTID